MFDKTAGFKTYLIALFLALGAVGGYLNDQLPVKELVEALLASAALVGLRHGVTTEVAKLKS